MQVRTIQFCGLMPINDDVSVHTVRLPPVGLVLVTGKNGRGKSRILEAVSFGVWNKTIRGTDPRQDNLAGYTLIETGFGMSLRRRWNGGGKKELDVKAFDAVGDTIDMNFESPSKAQDHVEGVVGAWDTWRRSCTFSMADDVMFSTASDAERKRLLESLLGLRRFDDALVKCRIDLKLVEATLSVARQTEARALTRLEEARKHVEAMRALADQAAPSVDLATLNDRKTALEAELTFKGMEAQTEREAYRKAQRAADEHRLKIEEVKRRFTALNKSESCPTCSQPWPDLAHRKAEQAKLHAELSALQAEGSPAVDHTAFQAADAAHSDVQRQLADARAQVTQAQAALQRHARAQLAVKEAAGEVLDLETGLDVARADVGTLETQAAHLESTDNVLGTKGARAHMLADALTGLEAAANVWLDRIARTDAPLSLRLSPYSERKSGGTSDSISMEVVGAGGGKGYKASSGGERRRIDVAIMLALAEVAQAADGRVAPTMWFDEVFDALDADGVEAVTRALDQLAGDRCVVVISHNEDLIRNLVPDLRVHVDAGSMSVR